MPGLLRLLLIAATLITLASATSGVAVRPPASPAPVAGPTPVPLERTSPRIAAAPPSTPAPPEATAIDCSDPTGCTPENTVERPPPIDVPTDPSCRLSGDHAPAGTTRIAPVAAIGVDQGRVLRFQVEIENGLAIDDGCFASLINGILNDPRGWGADGTVSFQQVEEEPDFRLILASPQTTDRLCYPLRTAGKYSCRSRTGVILNLLRWEEGTEDYADDLQTYREYLVNHEVGHLLGYGHVGCPGPGEPAPVMMQQTKGLDECRLNGWPTVDER